MIKLFKAIDLEFNSNGDKIIKAKKARVKKVDNGDFFLYLECGLEYIDDIVENAILVANMPQGDQAFRVSNVSKTKSKIITTAKHVFFDSNNYLIKDSYVVDKNCSEAMNHLNAATEPASPFATFSDISTVGSYRCVRKSLYEALEVVRNRWGGHFIRDNFSIGLRKEIGVDSDVVIRYKKNLKEITCEENWDDVITKILPVGKDGILLNELDPERSVYIRSSKTYSIPYTKTISFSQDDINIEDYTDDQGVVDDVAYYTALVEDLERQAVKYLEENDTPKISYTLTANLENITDIGDKIHVIHEPLNLNLTASVIGFEYDCILKKYTEINFGNFQKDLTGLINEINSNTSAAINEQTNILQTAFGEEIAATTGEIWDLLDNSYVVYQGDKLFVVDSLPKEQAQKIIKFDKTGINISSNGLYGTFHNVWNINSGFNFEHFELVKWGIIDIGKSGNAGGKIKLFSSDNSLFAEFYENGVKLNCSNNTYLVCNRQYAFALFDENDNVILSLENDEFKAKKGGFTEELSVGENIKLLSLSTGVGIFKK